MTTRRSLQTILLAAWHRSIDEHYVLGQINSERCLQASLWSLLVALLPANRWTFIEPTIRASIGSDRPRIIPDLATCNSQSVIAVVELKYTPRLNPQCSKDLESLNWLAENRSKLFIENQRFRGREVRLARFPFSKQVLFCWASVHKRQSNHRTSSQTSAGYPALADCCIEIFAETTHDARPDVGLRPSGSRHQAK